MKNSELIDQLVALADGDFELVQTALRESAKGEDGAADLKDIVDYIVQHRELQPAAA